MTICPRIEVDVSQISKKTVTIDWTKIESVLLDMDGTLLDRHFDDYFWEQHVPENYAERNGINLGEARKKLLARYKSKEGTLEWTDLDYWSNELNMNIPQMKVALEHLIKIHPYVIEFLEFCRGSGKNIYLVTNAHIKTLNIKMQKTLLTEYFDRIVCSQEIGLAKEDPEFWRRLHNILGFDHKTALLADDNQAVLGAAEVYGIKTLIYVARPSSTAPILHSNRYQSIEFFNELMGS